MKIRLFALGVTAVLLVATACSSGSGAAGPSSSSSSSAAASVSGGAPAPAASGRSASSNQSDIQIGLTLDLTGGGSLVGQGVKYGVEMAEKEINANGGINGRKLDFIEVDSASSPGGGVLAVRKLIQSDKVPIIFGGSTSSSTVSALPFVRSSKIPYYASIPSDPAVLTPFNKYVFEGAALPQGTVVPSEVAFLTDQLKAKKVALIASSDAYAVAARDLLGPAMTKAGITVTTTQNYAAGDTDFSAQIQAIKSSSSDAVFSIGLPGDAAKVLTQARRAGITVPMIGDSAQADNQTISLAGADSANYYTFWFSSHQFLDDATGVMGSWRTAFKADFPSPPTGVPNQWTLQSYSDVYVVAQALLTAGGTDSDKFIAALEGIQNFVAGENGTFSYAHPVGLPRGFTSTDHQGARTLVPVQVKGGHFKPATTN